MPQPIFFRGIVTASSVEAPAHCSAPPMQSHFRLPRLSRDAEAVTRPRTPLLPAKWEEASESGAVVEFGIGEVDEAVVKVEEEEPIEIAEVEQGLCARLSAVRILPQSTATVRPKGLQVETARRAAF